MDNERLVEQYVRGELDAQGFLPSMIEEQNTINTFIAKGLAAASKVGTGNKGFPEFIIRFPARHDTVMIVECKARKNCHISSGGNAPVDFAVDGVLHYAKHLAKFKHHVIAVAVSGISRPLISTFLIEYNELGELLIRDINLNKIEAPPFYLRLMEEGNETIL